LDGGELDLSTAVLRSPLLDPSLKRQWLRVLPFLSLRDRARLLDILR
jgi:hypothetical protein